MDCHRDSHFVLGHVMLIITVDFETLSKDTDTPVVAGDSEALEFVTQKIRISQINQMHLFCSEAPQWCITDCRCERKRYTPKYINILPGSWRVRISSYNTEVTYTAHIYFDVLQCCIAVSTTVFHCNVSTLVWSIICIGEFYMWINIL